MHMQFFMGSTNAKKETKFLLAKQILGFHGVEKKTCLNMMLTSLKQLKMSNVSVHLCISVTRETEKVYYLQIKHQIVETLF